MRLRAARRVGPDGLGLWSTDGSFLDGFLRVFALRTPVQPLGQDVVAHCADEQAEPGRATARFVVRLDDEVGGDRADQRAGTERHHQPEPTRLRQLPEARDEQRADDQR